MKTVFTTRRILSAAFVSLGLVASAYAVAPKDDFPNGPGAGMHQKHMAREMKDMSRLQTELKLDAKQAALWQEAEKAMQESRNGMRERFRKHQQEMLALVSQPGADLRAAAMRMDDFKAEGQKLHQANRDRWLSVYDSLNAEQKEKARTFFKSKLERVEKHFAQRGGERG